MFEQPFWQIHCPLPKHIFQNLISLSDDKVNCNYFLINKSSQTTSCHLLLTLLSREALQLSTIMLSIFPNISESLSIIQGFLSLLQSPLRIILAKHQS